MINSTRALYLFSVLLFLICAVAHARHEITRKTLSLVSKSFFDHADTTLYEIISKGEAAGDYQAFPDVTRLRNGDLLVVFYAGDGHVTEKSNKYPKAGRICMVRSGDDGRTWSEAAILYDDDQDNRDPHINQLSDGTLICSFFNLQLNPKRGGTYVVRSIDNGKTWDTEPALLAENWFCSAASREFDGMVIQPVYSLQENSDNQFKVGFIRSGDMGKTWGKVIPVHDDNNLNLSETDVIKLKDGTLYAVMRGTTKNGIHMHTTTSIDNGKSWSAVHDIGFYGDAPSLTRLKSGEIVMSLRTFREDGSAFTGVRFSANDGKSWQGTYLVDACRGAYASTVELDNEAILIVYYEEGKGSAIRIKRLKKPKKIEGKQFSTPQPIQTIPE